MADASPQQVSVVEMNATWTQISTPDGSVYYQNKQTKQTQWENPLQQYTAVQQQSPVYDANQQRSFPNTQQSIQNQQKKQHTSFCDRIKRNCSLVFLTIAAISSFALIIESLNANELIKVTVETPRYVPLDDDDFDPEELEGMCTFDYSTFIDYDPGLRIYYDQACDDSFSADMSRTDLPAESGYNTDYKQAYCIMDSAGNYLRLCMDVSCGLIWTGVVFIILYFIVTEYTQKLQIFAKRCYYRLALVLAYLSNVGGLGIFMLMANNANNNYYGFYCLCYHFNTYCYNIGSGSGCAVGACNAINSPFEFGKTMFYGSIAAVVLLICSIIECCSAGCQNKPSK